MLYKKLTLFFIIYMIFLSNANAGIPHRIYGDIRVDGATPSDETVKFKAFITERENDLLKESDTGCGYTKGCWWLEVGNFSYPWSIGEILYISIIINDSQLYKAYIILNGKGNQFFSFPITNIGPPTADAGSDQLIKNRNIVMLNASNSYDPDNNISLYSWKQLEGPPIVLSNYKYVQPTFVPPKLNVTSGHSLTFQLTVTDHGMLTSTDFCIINISNENLPPIADAGLDQNVNEGDNVSLDASNSIDNDDLIVSYFWEQISGPLVTISDQSSVVASFTAPNIEDGGESLIFQLLVSDQLGLKSNDICIINIVKTSTPPFAIADSNYFNAIEANEIMLDASGSQDSDATYISYHWNQTFGYPVTLSDVKGEKPLFLAPPTQDIEELKFRLVVTDNDGMKSLSNISITIKDNGLKGFPETVLPFTSNSGKSLGVKVSGGNIVGLKNLLLSDTGKSFNKPAHMFYGLFDLQIKTYSVSGTADVIFFLQESVPKNYEWINYDEYQDGWYSYSPFTSYSNTDKQYTLTLVDGDIGDNDFENSTVVNLSGLGTMITPTSNQVINKSDDGGGGCFIALITNNLFLKKLVFFNSVLLIIFILSIIKNRKSGFLFFSILFSIVIINNYLFAEDITFNLKKGLNGVSIPFEDSSIKNAEELMIAIPGCEMVQFWNESEQKFIKYEKNGTEKNNFSVFSGNPYFVELNSDTNWTVSGESPTYIHFNLKITKKTNINAIAIPLDKSHLSNAGDLISDIPHCDTIWYFDSEKNGYVGYSSENDSNNFLIEPGLSYLINVTKNGVWPLPDIKIVEPVDGSIIYNNDPPIKIIFSDNRSGLNISSLNVNVNGEDWTSFFSVVSDHAIYTGSHELSFGENVIVSTISDNNGNIGSTISNFRISSARAYPVASPISGTSPLNVHFIAKGEDLVGGTIQVFRWDFDGNGEWDTYDTISKDYDYTYQNSGDYQATLFVQSSTGYTAINSVNINVENNLPDVTASINPSNGAVPLTVEFSGSATDKDGTIVLYEWDFDGDGVFDWSSETAGNTTYTFNDPGLFQAILRVTDNMGGVSLIEAVTNIVTPGPSGSPTAKVSATPTIGNSPLTIKFQGIATDPDGNDTIKSYEWDFNGDGIVESTISNPEFTYTEAGSHIVSLTVTDNSGLIGIDRTQIYVNMDASFSISNNTLNQSFVDINSNLSAATKVFILIKNKDGDIVRKLVDGEKRSLGTYKDTWDGKDDEGFPVNDGIHDVIFQYNIDEEVRTIDLTNSTGGTRNSVSQGSGCNQRNSLNSNASFIPFDDILYPVTFRLCKASEVTMFFGNIKTSDSETRTRTVLNRTVLPEGEHTIYWDGMDDNGNIATIPPGGQLAIGMWIYTLPDNAIYVTGSRPVFSNIKSDPNYFNPFSNTCLKNGNAIAVSYTISEDVEIVELQVFELETKKSVRVVQQEKVLSGDNQIFWDGKNNDGKYVEQGEYKLILKAKDLENNESMLSKVNFVKIYY